MALLFIKMQFTQAPSAFQTVGTRQGENGACELGWSHVEHRVVCWHLSSRKKAMALARAWFVIFQFAATAAPLLLTMPRGLKCRMIAWYD